MSSTAPRIPKIRSEDGLKGRMRASWRAMVTEKIFLAVEGPQVKGVLLTIPPSSFMAAGLLLHGAAVKVERPERSEDERP